MKNLLLIFCSLPFVLFGQFSDNFSDGDFINAPAWLGDTNFFEVENGELNLNGDENGGLSQLYTNVLTADSTNWEFYVRLELAPSSNNFAKVYLQSNSSDLAGALNGYFVRVGGVTGTVDALELYKQTGTEETLLISGEESALGFDPAEARVQVRRDNAGNWELWADYSDGDDFVLQGTANDNTHTMGSFMGLVCTYTSGRREDFYFDDFLVEPLFVDTAAPQLLSATPISSMEVDLVFDEPLDAASVIAGNFAIDNGLTVLSAELDIDNPSLVHLVLNDNLVNNQTYQIVANNISDTNANILNDGLASFTYFDLGTAEPFDIIINEFFPDKSPQIGLPDGEFVELYNRSSKTFDLAGFGIADATENFVPLPSFILQPDAYVIICNTSDVALYQIFGDAIGIALPALNDGGDDIILQNPDGVVINAVLSYSPSWISDEEKQQGGWSYELINPESPCLGRNNWNASNDLGGGTPGKVNSILNITPDDTAPSIVSAFATSSNQVRLVFSENLATDNISFSIDNGISINDAAISNTDVVLALNEELQVGVVYTVEVSNVADCLGNSNDVLTATFLLPEMASKFDVAINEILFNPRTGGSDFVELFNRSDKVLNLKGLEMSNSQNMQSTTIDNDYILMPDSFVVFTEDVTNILNEYYVKNPDALVFQDIPSFNNDEGNITILNGIDTIDSYNYNEDQHYAFIDDVDGVSLERIDPDGSSNAASNWHSAASVVGFATPTYQNSQYFQFERDAATVISLPLTTFSPDGDGFDDFLLVDYETEGAGWSSNVKIFDSKGRLIKDLVQSELLESTGTLKWDGETNDGIKAPMGIYILWVELFNTEGDTQHFKETFVLAGQL